MLYNNLFCYAKQLVFCFSESYMIFMQRLWSDVLTSPCCCRNPSSPKSNNSSLFNPHHNYILPSTQQSIYAAKFRKITKILFLKYIRPFTSHHKTRSTLNSHTTHALNTDKVKQIFTFLKYTKIQK